MLEIVGAGLLAAVTLSVSVAPCWSVPEVPVIVIVNIPVVALDEAVMVRVDDALPLAGGVMLAGEKVAVTPPGRPEILRLVELLKLFRLVMLTVELALLPLPPAFSDIEFGETAMLKSAGGLTTVSVKATL